MAWWRRCKRPASSPAEAAPLPEISLIVVCYNMVRELPRTLRSLSPGYQRGIRPGQCEIIVVDNGSTVPPVAADFADLGLDLTIHHWPDPTPSPVPAVNHGLAQARGGLVGVWIDGARMASPGLVAACAEAAALHPRPVIATPNYELGRQSQV
jgi:glycosyltransferase involved in cell wall biosynthesis